MLKYGAVASLFLAKSKPDVDNVVFHLHYRITFIVFLVSSLLVMGREYGNPIQCLGETIPSNVMNTYCYFTSTFSVPSAWIDKQAPYPGVGNLPPGETPRYHAYYQWVPFVLFLQALMFYFPRYLWKNLEGGVFRAVLGGLEKFTMDDDTRAKRHKGVVHYMKTHLSMHRNWSIRFFLCEALCLVNVVGNIYFTDFFLGGTFLKYGTEVINFPDMDPETRVDPMIRIFPKLTKCTFRKYGASGTIETHDAMCLLAVNIINEKIYIFLWFWLVILTVITSLWLVYRLGVIVSSALRKKLLEVIDPWGTVVAKTSEGVGVAFAEVNLSYLESVRKSMPVFTHRRNDLYFLSMEPRLHQHPR